MRSPASEKLEIIRLVEESKLSVKRTLEKLGVARSKFYRWYDLYQRFGAVGLEDRRSPPGRIWNRMPDAVRGQVIELALERPELRPGSWPSRSPTRKLSLSRKHRCIGCCERTGC